MASVIIRDEKVNGGRLTEIEFETEGDGSGPTYSPMYGADSGDPLVVIILHAYDVEFEMEITLTQDEDDFAAENIFANWQPDYSEDYELDHPY